MLLSVVRRDPVNVLRLAIDVAANRVDEIEEGVSSANLQRRNKDDLVLRNAQLHTRLEQGRGIRPCLCEGDGGGWGGG